MPAKLMEAMSIYDGIHAVIYDEDNDEYHKIFLTPDLIIKLISNKSIFSVKRKDPRSKDLLSIIRFRRDKEETE
jgi:hypothetical protein